MKLTELLMELNLDKAPIEFKEDLIRINQLYFDGLVENSISEENILEEQLSVLNNLESALRLTINGYYNNNKKFSFEEVRDLVLPNSLQIMKYGSKDSFKPRHLFGQEEKIHANSKKLSKTLKKKKINTIIPIAGGGFEPAILLSEYLNVKNIFPVRYSYTSGEDNEVLIPKLSPRNYSKESVSGRNILIVEDLFATGKTAAEVTNFVKKFPVKKLYLSIIYESYALYPILKDAGLIRSKSSKYLYEHQDN